MWTPSNPWPMRQSWFQDANLILKHLSRLKYFKASYWFCVGSKHHNVTHLPHNTSFKLGHFKTEGGCNCYTSKAWQLPEKRLGHSPHSQGPTASASLTLSFILPFQFSPASGVLFQTQVSYPKLSPATKSYLHCNFYFWTWLILFSFLQINF